jgi:MAF protein
MFHVRPAEVDESQRVGEAPGDYVLRLAGTKARACARTAHEDLTIIAADTSVVDGKNILGKPGDMAEAVDMLRRLCGRVHQVYTGIAVLRMADGKLLSDLCITDVPMRDYSDDEINAYVATGDPLDKAGAYAIQHPKFHPVDKLSGCFASVMGLPLCHLTRTLLELGIEPNNDIPEECQSNLSYPCPIYPAVLRGEKIG